MSKTRDEVNEKEQKKNVKVLTDEELDKHFAKGLDMSGDPLVDLSRVRERYLELFCLLLDTFEDQIAGNMEGLMAFFADDFRDALHGAVAEYGGAKEHQRALLAQFAGGPWYYFENPGSETCTVEKFYDGEEVDS